MASSLPDDPYPDALLEEFNGKMRPLVIANMTKSLHLMSLRVIKQAS